MPRRLSPEMLEIISKTRKDEIKQQRKEWLIDRLIEVVCMVGIVGAVVVIMLSMAGGL